MFLKMLKPDQIQDWQKTSNYRNYKAGLIKFPNEDKHLPQFQTPVFKPITGCAQFTLFKVEIDGNIKNYTETYELSPAYIGIKYTSRGGYLYFTELGSFSYVGWLKDGLYEFYVRDKEGDEFTSELFCINTELKYSGDWNIDWNNDWAI
jgi:hypothetical protein